MVVQGTPALRALAAFALASSVSACAAGVPFADQGAGVSAAGELPRVVGIRICALPVSGGRSTPGSPAAAGTPARDVIAFDVETSGDVPARGYGPALFVGDVEVGQSERLGATSWRFLAARPDRLAAGAPIHWGWMKARPEDRRRTAFTFVVERDPPRCSTSR